MTTIRWGGGRYLRDKISMHAKILIPILGRFELLAACMMIEIYVSCPHSAVVTFRVLAPVGYKTRSRRIVIRAAVLKPY